jgi:hypothetical protein
MKYLIAILLLSLSGLVTAGQCPDGSQNPNCDYPGYQPDWDSRYNVTITMTSVDGEVRATSMTGGLDYAQAGSLYGYQVMATKSWYEDLATLVGEIEGADVRMVPTPDSPMTQLIEIEKAIADR